METATPTPERLAFLEELCATWGGTVEELLAPPEPTSCCGTVRGSGCFRCRPEAWS